MSRGLQGAPFPSPFATPPGKGDWRPIANVPWGFFNLVAGLYLLSCEPVTLGINLNLVTMPAGVLAMGIFPALHFGKVQRHKRREQSRSHHWNGH